MYSNRRFRLPKFQFNAPVTLGFAAACLIVQIINVLTNGASGEALFMVWRTSFFDPMMYIRCVTSVFGHADWNHLFGNMMTFLLLAPLLEEKYGSFRLMIILLVSALCTGLVNVIFFPHLALCGASGLVFTLILLSSFVNLRGEGIPVTFLLVAALYLGQQVVNGLFTSDNVSQLSHIIGGLVGCGAGFMLRRRR